MRSSIFLIYNTPSFSIYSSLQFLPESKKTKKKSIIEGVIFKKVKTTTYSLNGVRDPPFRNFYSHSNARPAILLLFSYYTVKMIRASKEMSERGSEQGSVGTVLVAQHAILIESRSLWPCSQKRTVHPVEHDRRYFTPTAFRDDAHTPDRSRNWFPSNNYSLPGKQALSRDVGLATKLLPAAPRQPRVAPPPTSPPRITPFFPSSFVFLLTTVLEATFKQILSFYCLFAQVLFQRCTRTCIFSSCCFLLFFLLLCFFKFRCRLVMAVRVRL